MTSGFFTKKHVCHDFTWWFHILSWVNQKSLHSSQLRKAFRPRSQSVETQTFWWPMVAFVRWKKCHFFVVLICSTTCGNWSSWQEMAGGSIARLSNIADIHRLITDVLQLDNDTKKCWFLEEFVAANIMGIVGILHMLSCKRTHSIWEFFFWHFDDFRCNVWAKVYEMAWSTLVFSSVFWDTWRPIRLGAPSHNDVWTGGHTQASGQAYAQNCVGFQMFSGFCNYKTEMSIYNVIPATQNVLYISSCRAFCSCDFPFSAWDFDAVQEFLRPTLAAAMMPKKHIHMDT